MNKWKRIRPYVAFCAIALAVGGASSFATRAGMADFDLLTKPLTAPPDWLFPIAWTILYLLMGIAMGLVWRSSIGRARKEATALWSIQLAVNGLWPVLFFLLGAHGLSVFLARGADRTRAVHDRGFFPPQCRGRVAERAVSALAAVRGVSEPRHLAAQSVRFG